MTKETTNLPFFERDGFITFLFVLSGAVIFLGFGLAYLDWNPSDNQWENPGVKGDYWGGHIGAVANLAAFIVLVAATLLQRKELIESRMINTEIAAEAKNQADALSMQIKNSVHSQNVTSFFQLLTFVENGEQALTSASGKSTGRKYISVLAEVIVNSNQDNNFRTSFERLEQFICWIEVLLKLTEEEFEKNSLPAKIFSSKFNSEYLLDLYQILNFYSQDPVNLKKLAPNLWDLVERNERALAVSHTQ